MCKTVEDYAKNYAEEREKIVREEGRSEGLAEGTFRRILTARAFGGNTQNAGKRIIQRNDPFYGLLRSRTASG